MERTPVERFDQRDVAADLKAAVGARRELHEDMEDHVLEAFLARVDQRIVDRVDQQVGRTEAKRDSMPARSHGLKGSQPWVLPASLGTAIPLVAIAGTTAGAVGVIAVMLAVVILVGIYYGSD